MTNWIALVDRGIGIRAKHGDPPVFTVEEMSERLASAIDENEPDQDKLKLMNLCFDALVCLREQAARGLNSV